MPKKQSDADLLREHLNDVAALLLDAFSSVRLAAATLKKIEAKA
jgi:hypothetical protein